MLKNNVLEFFFLYMTLLVGSVLDNFLVAFIEILSVKVENVYQMVCDVVEPLI